MRITFLGATQTVTGSRYLVQHNDRRILVDCGLFQGYKHLRLKNWSRPPFEPRDIHAVVLTHAHIDHSGYLPLLVKKGFQGPIYASPATIELCRVLLPDSGHLHEEQAKFANRHGFSKHSPAQPLYTEADARRCLERFIAAPFGADFAPARHITGQFTRAGHLLGASSVRIATPSASILFSGDIGRPNDALMRPPAPSPAADYVVVESTYGNRRHADVDPQTELKEVILRAYGRNGVVLIPTFAVGRAQTLMLMIARLKAAGEIPDMPVYLDSPMAIDATQLLARFENEHRLMPADLEALHNVARMVRSAEESKALDRMREPAIILSASGMATGGRVVHHLKVFATDARNVIVFAGFQAGGTRGASLVAGAPSIRIHGEMIPVRAEVTQLSAMSSHADADELLAWLRSAPSAPRRVFITHGEPEASDALRQRVERELGWRAHVPEYRDEFELE